MASRTNRLAAASMIAAAFSMFAVPVEARDRWRHGHHDGIDAGDVIAGVLILGGIAAIASAASKREREERYPPPPREPSEGYRGVATAGPYQGGLGRAVDLCVAEVEGGFGRVGSVDGANRAGEGWQVSGELDSGRAWSCWIGNDGHVSGIDLTDGYSSSAAGPEDGQWSDEAYARARAEQGEPAAYGG